MSRPNLGDSKFVSRGLRHLKGADPVMASIIRQVGAFKLKPSRERFGMLVRSILSQQISVAAARTIRNRLLNQMPNRRFTATAVLEFSIDDLRAIGISRQKAGYLLSLAEHSTNGSLNFRRIGQLHDEDVIAELIQVKGIGRWTAQMFLIFGLGRPDIFAPDDLGLRAAIRNQYDFHDMPSNTQASEVAAVWSPYASIASWYCWRSLEMPK
ncbi:MAG: DNA-3-methyladenine glycosylase [Planctomycetaceae bacterium]